LIAKGADHCPHGFHEVLCHSKCLGAPIQFSWKPLAFFCHCVGNLS
jgi:hypothetical protein